MNEKKRDLLQSLVSELQESEEIQDICSGGAAEDDGGQCRNDLPFQSVNESALQKTVPG